MKPILGIGGDMILHCTFEELTALNSGAERVLSEVGTGGVAAPPQVLSDIEALAPRLTGDLDIETLAEQRSVQSALDYLLEEAHARTDLFILEQYPAAEAAVISYFEYAHILTVLDRVKKIGAQMAALIELMTGDAPTAETAKRFSFPD